MSKLKSRTKLFKTLSDILGDPSFITEQLNHPMLANENYGDEMSMVYITYPTNQLKQTTNQQLRDLGFKVNATMPDNSTEIKVEFFTI